jgi:hypothetical protein
MAVKKTVEIDIKSNSKKADKDLKEIKKDIDAIGKSAKKNLSGENAKKLNKELDKTAQAAKNTKTRLRELEDELADIGDVNSPQFQKLAKEAGVLRDQMNNAKAAVRSMSADFPRLQLGVQAFQAIGGAAQGAMGAAALFGSENEEVTKSIQKLMAVQSILNSVNAVANALSDETALGLKVRTVLTNLQAKGDKKLTLATIRQTAVQTAATAATKVATVGMRIFNAVVNANPLFLLVTAITAVVGAFAWFFSSSEDLEAQNEKLNASFDRQIEKMDKLSNRRKKNAEEASRELEASIKKEIQLLKEKGADAELLRDVELGFEVQRIQQRLKNAEAEEKERVDRIKANKDFYNDAAKRRRKAYKEEEYELGDSINQKMKARRKENEQLILLNNEYNTKKIELNTELEIILSKNRENNRKDEEADYKARQDRYKEFLQKKEAARKQIEDLTNQAIEDDEQREIAKAKTKHERDIENIVGTEDQKNQIKILKADELEKKLAEIRAKYREEEIPLRKQADLTEETANIDAAVAKRKTEEQTQKYLKEYDEEEAQRKRDLADQRLSLASETFGALGDLATAFAKDDEKSAERAFKVNKAVGIAQAVISTAQGVMAQLSVPQDALTGANFVKAGIVAATGAAQIATIAKSKFQGGAAGSSPTAPSGSVSTPSSQPASFNVVGNSGVNQLAETLGNQGQQPIQAFVVGSEVTTQQSLDRNKVETATL